MAEFSDIPEGFQVEKQFSDIPEGFAVEEPREPRTLSEKVFRGLGLAGRDIIEGAAGVAGIVTNPIGFTVNKASNVLGGPDISSQDLRGDVSSTLSRLGVPEPVSRGEKVGSRINQALVGGGGFVGTGRAIAANAPGVARTIGQTLAAQPALQGASAVTSAGAVEALPEDAHPLVKLGVGLVGAAGPSVATAGTAALTRAAARGGEAGRQVVASNVDDFARAGTAPTVGQATQGRVQQAVESGLSRAPGSAGVMSRTANQQADDIAVRVRSIADDLAPKATATRAGASIKTGVSKFVDDFKIRANQLYDNVDVHIPKGSTVKPTKTKAFLDKTNAPVPGAESTSKILANKFLDDVGIALDDDIRAALEKSGIEGLPYEAIKSLRSRVGEKLGNLSLVADVSKGQLKQLYGALSDDLTKAASDISPAALREANKANGFWKAGMSRISAVESVIKRKGGPEKVFQAALSGTKEGATILRTVMKSIRPEDQKMVTAAVIRRLGIATPGKQGAAGDVFSIETYLTNWAKLSPEARSVLFGKFGTKFQADVNALSKVAENIRTGSQVFSNPSGTAQAVTLNTTAGGAVAALIFGRIELAAGLGALVGGANLSSRLMTNPRFVRWLARATTVPEAALPAQIRALSDMASKTKDEDLALAVGLLQQDEQEVSN